MKQAAREPGGAVAKSTQARDRVNDAIGHRRPDLTPRDFAAVPEIWRRLQEHFGTSERGEVLMRLGVDCRVVSYDSFCQDPEVNADEVDSDASQERSSVGGMWRHILADGSNRDIWGAHRRKVANAFGVLEQFASHPLAGAASLEDLKLHRWPQPDWWDFRGLPQAILALNDDAVFHIRYRVGSVFETAWSLVGFERFLSDLALQPELPAYLMERIAEVHLANLETALRMAGRQIDLVVLLRRPRLAEWAAHQPSHVRPVHPPASPAADCSGSAFWQACHAAQLWLGLFAAAAADRNGIEGPKPRAATRQGYGPREALPRVRRADCLSWRH